MSTLQLAQPPKGANDSGANGHGATGHGSNGHAPAECSTGKKAFASREEAERFEAENRKRFPKQGRQYAYKCEQCPAYHLTSKPLDAFAIGQTNLKRLESLATSESSPKVSRFRGGRGETEAEVKRLWEQGLSDAEIASQIGISHAGVCHHRKKFGAANNRTSHNTRRQTKAPLTLAEYDEQKKLLEQEYQAKLLGLEHHKQRLEDASKLMVTECEEGKSLYIKFGHHERMVVPKDKIQELTTTLMQWV
jgi:hypothetical protein